jgi:hypothetical protein
MEAWSLKAAVNDEQGQPSMQTGNEASSQGIVTAEAPGRFDVLLGRGKQHARHPGNERLQIALIMHSLRYNTTTSRNEKTSITKEIVRSIHAADPPGRFVKFDKEANGWVEIDDAAARIRVSHAIRYTSRYKKRKTPPELSQEASTCSWSCSSTIETDASRRREVYQQERPRDPSPLIFDERIIAGLGHAIHHSSNDTIDDDASVR